MMARVVDEGDWDHEVLGHPGVVVVVLCADWCDPDSRFEAAGDALAEELAVAHPQEVVVVRVAPLDLPRVQRRYGVSTLPTLLVVRRGELVHRVVGAGGGTHLRRELAAFLPQPDRRPSR